MSDELAGLQTAAADLTTAVDGLTTTFSEADTAIQAELVAATTAIDALKGAGTDTAAIAAATATITSAVDKIKAIQAPLSTDVTKLGDATKAFSAAVAPPAGATISP